MTSIVRPDPEVRIGDFSFHSPSWPELDEQASRAIGVEGVVVPSVRVGMLWTLQYLGFRRHADHVMVPRFMGRCILNSLNRAALPVEHLSPSTRAVIVLHQYGFRQDLEKVQQECASRQLPYLEDSPFGLEELERLGPGSLAKFLGFAKVLPALKGGFGISDDAGLLDYMREQRKQRSMWSWPMTAVTAFLRHGSRAHLSTVVGELAYELYPSSPSDNFLVRGNVSRALQSLDSFAAVVKRRLTRIADALGDCVSIPDTSRLASFIPLRPEGRMEELSRVVKKHDFDSTLYHFDFAKNLFAPRYEKVLLIPVNPRIPDQWFDSLVDDLQRTLDGGGH